jgi:hypothetical protein
MSLSSLIIGRFAQHLQTPGSLVLLPLPEVDVPDAVHISLEEWLARPLDVRAPVRSIAMVDVVNDDFIAFVIDSVTDRPRFRIRGPMNSIEKLYEGMRSPLHAPSRGTVVLAAIPSRPVPDPDKAT